MIVTTFDVYLIGPYWFKINFFIISSHSLFNPPGGALDFETTVCSTQHLPFKIAPLQCSSRWWKKIPFQCIFSWFTPVHYVTQLTFLKWNGLKVLFWKYCTCFQTGKMFSSAVIIKKWKISRKDEKEKTLLYQLI